MFFLQSRQAIPTPAEHQLTPDLATAFKYQGCGCGKYKKRSRFKTAVSGIKRTERWDRIAPEDRDHKLGFIYSNCDFLFLKPCNWPTWSRRIAVAFLCNNWIVTARGSLFWNHSSKQGELAHTAPCMPAPGDAAGAGRGAGEHKVCLHPHRMSLLIENNQSGRNNFLSFIRKFLLPSPIPVPSLPGHTPDNFSSTVKSMCVARSFFFFFF